MTKPAKTTAPQQATQPESPGFQKEDDMSKNGKITALYERLSVGDEGRNGDSNSIKHQKMQLETYAKEQGFTNIKHYTDDDESGRFFDRSGYAQMIDDVESGKIGTCIMKDLTRWGRDHVQVGIAMELFRKNGVRFIAINHGIDSINPESLEMAPFINIMSEWFAKDCSKKIKSVFRAKGLSGKPLTSIPPYGYLRNPEDTHTWMIDEEAAAVVRRIFTLVMEGKGIYQICCTLTEDKIPVPGHYLGSKGIGRWANASVADPYAWHINTVERIIGRREYCGDTVNFKTSKHLKDKHSIYNDESDWAVFEDTHEAIIDRDTFENVQRIFKNLKCPLSRKKEGKMA